MGAYYLMFGVVFKIAPREDFPLFIMVGLVVWLFFAQSLLGAAPSLLDQGALIRKARFPRWAIPASVVCVRR
jgi:ABC-type polysaccharide/polyol phosphate export permease